MTSTAMTTQAVLAELERALQAGDVVESAAAAAGGAAPPLPGRPGARAPPPPPRPPAHSRARTRSSSSASGATLGLHESFRDICGDMPRDYVARGALAVCNRLCAILHRYYVIQQWHRDPFAGENSGSAYLHRPIGRGCDSALALAGADAGAKEEADAETTGAWVAEEAEILSGSARSVGQLEPIAKALREGQRVLFQQVQARFGSYLDFALFQVRVLVASPGRAAWQRRARVRKEGSMEHALTIASPPPSLLPLSHVCWFRPSRMVSRAHRPSSRVAPRARTSASARCCERITSSTCSTGPRFARSAACW